MFILFYFNFEVLAESSKQLLDCAFERSIVPELLPQHGSLSAGVKTYPSPLSLKPDPTGPFTPGTPGHIYLKSLTLPLSLLALFHCMVRYGWSPKLTRIQWMNDCWYLISLCLSLRVQAGFGFFINSITSVSAAQREHFTSHEWCHQKANRYAPFSQWGPAEENHWNDQPRGVWFKWEWSGTLKYELLAQTEFCWMKLNT